MRFDGTSSVNPEDGAMTYTWEFSDGAVVAGAVVDHAFPDNGTYTVKLTVNNGAAASTTRSILVDNSAQVLTVGTLDPVLLNSIVPLRLSVNDVRADSGNTLQYSIDWNDGSAVQAVTWTSARTVNHVFLRTGTFFVKSQVTDKDGGLSRIVSTRVIVNAAELKDQILTIEGTEITDTIVIRHRAVAELCKLISRLPARVC
ncbi:MAG: PKD domain-containing protein [Fuerstia sp.]|nr:PKD domain-containing protein [Fuerstiella sp.]